MAVLSQSKPSIGIKKSALKLSYFLIVIYMTFFCVRSNKIVVAVFYMIPQHSLDSYKEGMPFS